ncbi:unnamed protein product [Oikopleura dioica]|uniref:Fibrinogen C-terminal domain-containing protein n=1 Tax=Oikopleura dioica TaxID=34765 RepID=E4XL36_OIKDI|nr:unnamed protein product [Oikopleura dioica]
MKLLALFSTITCAQGFYGSGDCDGENCEISVSMPALSFRLPGTANIQKELIRQREKFKLADNDRKRLRFEIIELRKSIEESRQESEKNSEEIKEAIKNSFDEEINEKRKNLEEVFQNSMEKFQLELKSSLIESVGKFGNDSTLLAKSLVSMTSMIDIVTRDFQKYLDDFHEKISSANFTSGTNSCPEPSQTDPTPPSEPLKYSSPFQQAQVKIDSENSGASILKCYQCCEEIPITNDMIARLLGVQLPDDSSMMQENEQTTSQANTATVTTLSTVTTTSTTRSSLSTSSSTTTSTSLNTKAINDTTSQSIVSTTMSKINILDNAVTSIGSDNKSSQLLASLRSYPTIETAPVDVSPSLEATTIVNNSKNHDERAAKASPPKQPFEKICNDDCLSDCAEYKRSGFNDSGLYRIKLSVNRVIEVFCDMKTDGGGWTTVQRRVNGSVDFNQPWNSYKNGNTSDYVRDL